MIEALLEFALYLLGEIAAFVVELLIVRAIWAAIVAIGWRGWLVIAGLGAGLVLATTSR